ncbi:zinc ribbon domain-containing protein [Staphylococcus warneri]|uniref:zinc ribbon domain-containing protein n=1 Tax=Staphylococcus pasteuri TaxID=45972 RepID=UPI000F5E17DC|nr:zinc ribbon domain-containing protein [Staphylococcus pasteuri]RQX28460.1 zinc ribbon domain-containing protein [Staphylococcus warneri]
MKCPNCGHQIEQDDVFCGECGTKVNRQSNAVTSAEDDIKQADSHSNKQQATQSTHNSTMNSTSNASHEQSQSMNQSNASAETHANHNQYQHSQPNNTQQQYQNQNPNQNQYQNQYQNYNQNQQYQQQPHQYQQQTNQFSEQAKEVTQESKGFFKSAFVDPDREIKSTHTFSFKLLGSLLAIGLIVLAIILFLAIPEEVSLFTSESKIVFSIIISLIILLAAIVGTIFGMTRLVVVQAIPFKKVFSDFILINSVTVAMLLVSIILLVMEAYTFGMVVLMLSFVILVASGVYLIAKYSGINFTRFSSFYGIVIYLIVIFILMRIFGEVTLSSILESFDETRDSFFNNLFGGGSGY